MSRLYRGRESLKALLVPRVQGEEPLAQKREVK